MRSNAAKALLEEQGWYKFQFGTVYYFNSGKMLVDLAGFRKRELNDPKRYSGLFIGDTEKLSTVTICSYISDALSHYRHGSFEWTVPDERRLVFFHPIENKSQENGKWYYALTVHDLESDSRSYIKREYTPAAIPDSVINNHRPIWDTMRDDYKEDIRRRNKEMKPLLKEIGVYPPVKDLFSDGKFIFVITNEADPVKGDVTEVIDCDTGELVSRAYFPFIPDDIKNGRAFRLAKNSDGFKVIQIYTIDPAVYGK